MTKSEPLVHGQYYHIFNRGNGGENLFREERNYPYFLGLFARYIEPVAETYAYCLMPNHFHVLVRIKDWQVLSSEGTGGPSEDCRSCPPEDCRSLNASRSFSSLFSTYTKALNKAFERTGSLFEKPFHRILVDSDRYFAALVAYIHHNPQRHGFVDEYRSWPHSSYQAILSDKATRIQRDVVLEWFGGRAGFEMLHDDCSREQMIEPLVGDDFL
ncbi:transposase [Chloroflexota bacterium]